MVPKLTDLGQEHGRVAGGRLAVVESWAPRGPGSLLHVHHREAEFWYVIKGEVTMWVDGELFEAPEGSLVYGPPNVPHTFAITSEHSPRPLRTRH